MKNDAPIYLLAIAFSMFCFGAGFAIGRLGTEPVAPPPQAIKTTDQQCVAWLFETNLKEVKKKICR